MNEAATTTMASFLTTIGSFFTQTMTWVGNVITVIMDNPGLTVLCLAMPICGFAIGTLNRLIRL